MNHRAIGIVATSALLATACAGKINGGTRDGNDAGAPEDAPLPTISDGGSDGETSARALCALPPGPPVAVPDDASCESSIRGKWLFCSGETTLGPATSFISGSDGIVFTDESGAWRFYYLYANSEGNLVRATDLDKRGSVDFHRGADGCEPRLSYDDQNAYFWQVGFFAPPREMSFAGGQVSYRFVAVP
jgi:hypothetical protein